MLNATTDAFRSVGRTFDVDQECVIRLVRIAGIGKMLVMIKAVVRLDYFISENTLFIK